MKELPCACSHGRDHEALGDGTLGWDGGHEGDVLSFTRSPGFRCVVDFDVRPVKLPAHEAVLLSSGPLEGALLPGDTAVRLTQ
ncbi:hypothetical protein [Wenjunlia tyrosinilytica]|uniref:Uncharacterized protein n=1 Tax=Wenjunlia tyrosinilytica TaxID=1544741 RepID=A0A918E1J8_9ACTN|nr:hypothetical protein [Wenjunlia tyrosinilytica]GGO97947.1 hypothetical protein GCM10012280_60930 [Wenjunlia tyrosinilytica]